MPDTKVPDYAVLWSSLCKSCYLSAIVDFFLASAASYCVHAQFIDQKCKTSRVILQK